jgi:hypothetical protein
VAADHTRVELEHRGWERLGDQGHRSRAGYESGWPSVLAAFAATAMDGAGAGAATSSDGNRPTRFPAG